MKTHRKILIVDLSQCIRCYQCIEECPVNAIAMPTDFSCAKCVKYCITMEVPCQPEKLIFDHEKCNECGQCIKACSRQALHWHEEKQEILMHNR